MLIESMIQEMGGRQSQTFIRMLNNGYTEEMHQAVYLLFIYLTFIKQADDEQIALWRDVLLRAGLSPELTPSTRKRRCFYSLSFRMLMRRTGAIPPRLITSVSTAKLLAHLLIASVPRVRDRLQEHAVKVGAKRLRAS